MKKAKEYGHLAMAIDKMPVKPVLNVTARVGQSYGPDSSMDKSYHKSQADRLRKEVKHGEDSIASWDHQKVGQQALSSLKKDMAAKRAQLMEHEAYLDEEPDNDDTAVGAEVPKGQKGKTKGKDYSSVGEGSSGSVVGGPYEIVAEGGKFKVKNMETGKTKGTFKTRPDALKQFRLLEMIEHGKKPKGK